MFLFLLGNLSFSFFTNAAYKFWKDVNGIIHGKTIIVLNQARVISIAKVSVSHARDFHGFNERICSILESFPCLFLESFPRRVKLEWH